MAARLSEAERSGLEARRARLQLELRLLTAELRSDEALRVTLRRRDRRLVLRWLVGRGRSICGGCTAGGDGMGLD
jgi:hypothetical protein